MYNHSHAVRAVYRLSRILVRENYNYYYGKDGVLTMNKTLMNVLKVGCVAIGAALTMVGNIMGNGDNKYDAKNDSGTTQK